MFSDVSQEGFPTYNTSFQAAFNKAREELGPNALFRYKGKLYHTNHPNEVNQNVASGFKDLEEKKSIDDILKLSKFKDVDFLNIDVEGKDLSILTQLVPYKLKPTLISIETHNVDGTKTRDCDKINDYLKYLSKYKIGEIY